MNRDDAGNDPRKDYVEQGKQFASDLRDSVTKKVADNEDTLRGTLGKAARWVDEKTGGKYADKISKAESAVNDGIGRVASQGGGDATPHGPGASAGDGTSPTDPGASTTPPGPIHPTHQDGPTASGFPAGPGASAGPPPDASPYGPPGTPRDGEPPQDPPTTPR